MTPDSVEEVWAALHLIMTARNSYEGLFSEIGRKAFHHSITCAITPCAVETLWGLVCAALENVPKSNVGRVGFIDSEEAQESVRRSAKFATTAEAVQCLFSAVGRMLGNPVHRCCEDSLHFCGMASQTLYDVVVECSEYATTTAAVQSLWAVVYALARRVPCNSVATLTFLRDCVVQCTPFATTPLAVQIMWAGVYRLLQSSTAP